jgi:Lon protease-like protein
LVRDCVASELHEFGVVLIERGNEVGGGDVRRLVGTIARMVQVGEMDDGRFAVIAIGVGRLRVNAWLPDDPYPTADIDEWPDEVGPSDGSEAVADLLRSVTQRTRRAAALALQLGDVGAGAEGDLADDLSTASYQLAGLAPIGPADAYDLLCTLGPTDRLRALEELLVDVEAAQAFRLQPP